MWGNTPRSTGWIGSVAAASRHTRSHEICSVIIPSENGKCSMNHDTKVGFLKDEYLLLQKFYEDFDARIVTIKGWSATIGLAAIGTGFFQSQYLWLFAALSALVFWGTEAVWKSFQYMYVPRIQELEEAFRKESFDNLAPFQIYASWFEVFDKQGFDFFGNLRLPIVLFPHALTVVIGVMLFLLQKLGVHIALH